MAEILSSYNLIIAASVIIILSFFFGEVARKTNIPSVLMLIVLGIVINFAAKQMGAEIPDLFDLLEVLGIVGLIMIVLEAALELELKRDKAWPITKALLIALVGLMASTWAAALLLHQFIPEMDMNRAWLYATPLSILSSAIIIPSVSGLQTAKKEFHIYESTFSDILGIMLFYFILGQMESHGEGNALVGFGGNVLLTVFISFVASYLIILIFQNIKSHTKLFLLISVLLLLYSVAKQQHLSSLLIILIFGLIIANKDLFFRGFLKKWLNEKKAKEMYDHLHIITLETAFVVRTFFFVIFGITISLSSLLNLQVALVSALIIASIYAIRWILMRFTYGKDIFPQLFIAPRGLITILLFYAIPESLQVTGFDTGILLFIILATSVIMTFAMVADKRSRGEAVRSASSKPIGYEKWEAPTIDDV